MNKDIKLLSYSFSITCVFACVHACVHVDICKFVCLQCPQEPGLSDTLELGDYMGAGKQTKTSEKVMCTHILFPGEILLT